MNDRGWNSRRRQRQCNHLIWFFWLKTAWSPSLPQCIRIRKDEGSTSLKPQLGTIFFYRVCWYSQTWFINLQLCVLTFGHVFFFFLLSWMDRAVSCTRVYYFDQRKGGTKNWTERKTNLLCVIMQSVHMRGIYNTYTNTTLLQRSVKKRINWNEIWSHGKYEIISISQTGDTETSRIPLFFFIARVNNVLWQEQGTQTF